MGGTGEQIIKRSRKRDPVRELEVAGNSGGLEFLPSLQLQAKSKLLQCPALRPHIVRIARTSLASVVVFSFSCVLKWHFRLQAGNWRLFHRRSERLHI
jgi:hypothetical protein